MGSNEFALTRADDGIELFRTCTEAVYRNEFGIALKHPRIARKIVSIGKSYHKAFTTFVMFSPEKGVPIDHFFALQAANLNRALAGAVSTQYFAGSSIDSFDGVLGELNYMQPVWTARLVLAERKDIECTLDRSKGEDAYNGYGNKRVRVTGRSIYRGDSLLPSRFEIIRNSPDWTRKWSCRYLWVDGF